MGKQPFPCFNMYIFNNEIFQITSASICNTGIILQGVTYCGDSKASNLTMENVPWHEEVVKFVGQLADLLPQYEIAAEHEHSNCLLISHKKVKCLSYLMIM